MVFDPKLSQPYNSFPGTPDLFGVDTCNPAFIFVTALISRTTLSRTIWTANEVNAGNAARISVHGFEVENVRCDSRCVYDGYPSGCSYHAAITSLGVCNVSPARNLLTVEACDLERIFDFFRCGGSNMNTRASPNVQLVSEMAERMCVIRSSFDRNVGLPVRLACCELAILESRWCVRFRSQWSILSRSRAEDNILSLYLSRIHHLNDRLV
jgi:hypothetical protein